MSNQWFYVVDGKPVGPVAAAQLKQMAQAGSLRPDDLVWKEGLDNWVTADRVQGLCNGAAPQAGQPARATGCSTIQAQEVDLGSGAEYALMLSISIPAEAVVAAAFAAMPATIVDWIRQRGRQATRVLVTVIAPGHDTKKVVAACYATLEPSSAAGRVLFALADATMIVGTPAGQELFRQTLIQHPQGYRVVLGPVLVSGKVVARLIGKFQNGSLLGDPVPEYWTGSAWARNGSLKAPMCVASPQLSMEDLARRGVPDHPFVGPWQPPAG